MIIRHHEKRQSTTASDIISATIPPLSEKIPSFCVLYSKEGRKYEKHYKSKGYTFRNTSVITHFLYIGGVI